MGPRGIVSAVLFGFCSFWSFWIAGVRMYVCDR